MCVLGLFKHLIIFFLQLQRSPDTEEAHSQLHRVEELEQLQEEARKAHHRGDYTTTIQVLERVIEVSFTKGKPKNMMIIPSFENSAQLASRTACV